MMTDSNFKKIFALLSDVDQTPKKQMKNDVAKTKAFIISTGWRASLYRVLRLEWTGTKLKKPVDIPWKVLRTYQPHGDLMHEILRLCQAAHRYADEEWKYKSWLDWFLAIVVEAVEASSNLEEKSKTRKLDEQRQYLKLLRVFKNPYSYKTEPHLWRLIETWIKELAEFPRYEENYWIPFMRCFSKWLTERDTKNWGCLFEEKAETQITLKSGNGQGHRHLNLACTILIKKLKNETLAT